MIIRRDAVAPFDFSGLDIRDYTAGLEAGSSFAVISASPGASHAKTWSKRSDKYYYIISGTIEFTDVDGTHELGAGDFCLVPQGEWFSYRNPTEETATLCLLHTPSFDLGFEVFED
jgi:mannose-6-phosphate isomerase-like protein (cupin superfamily)